MNVRELRSSLKKLDVVEDRSGHHIYFYLEIDKREYRVCKISHSMRGELPPFIKSDTARRMKLNSDEFNSLVECLLDKNAFLTFWKLRDP